MVDVLWWSSGSQIILAAQAKNRRLDRLPQVSGVAVGP